MEGLAAQQEQQAKHRSKAGGWGVVGVPTNLDSWGMQTPKWSFILGVWFGVWVRGLGSGFGFFVFSCFFVFLWFLV